MNGDDLAELLRALVELQRAEDASARAAWALAEAEEADPPRLAEVARARERYEAAVAAVEAARARRRKLEARLGPAEADRAHAMLASAVAEPGPLSGEVTVAGRTFTLGTIYAPRSGRGYDRRPRRLLSYSTDGPPSGGRVMVEMVPAGGQRIMAGTRWAAWAGEPVEDVGR